MENEDEIIKQKLEELKVYGRPISREPFRAKPPDLSHMDLSGVDFSGLNLFNVNFEGAILINANFKKTILIGTNFKGAVLCNADFRGAYIGTDTSFENADVSGMLIGSADRGEYSFIVSDSPAIKNGEDVEK